VKAGFEHAKVMARATRPGKDFASESAVVEQHQRGGEQDPQIAQDGPAVDIFEIRLQARGIVASE